MEFEWDEAKRQSNLVKHTVDFRDTRRLFDGRPVVTTRGPYPDEARYLTTGIIEDRFVTVVWTRRNNATRIISARRARDGEQRAYRALHGGGA
ncbi:MAG: BrnT family toxin [Thermomicrobiales bacterium]